MASNKHANLADGVLGRLAATAPMRRLFPRWHILEKRKMLGILPKSGLRIVLVNIYEQHGGAAIATKRLFSALRKEGVDVWMLVKDKTTRDDRVIEAGLLAKRKQEDFGGPVLETDTYFTDCFSGLDIGDALEVFDPDIVNCHWIAETFVYLPSLVNINAPVIFTMHDQWYATGGCHYTCWSHSGLGNSPCDGYLRGCLECPKILKGDKTCSKRIWDCKKAVYGKLPRKAFVGVSSWVVNEMRLSGIAGETTFETVHNPIDTDLYKPDDKMLCRKGLGLEPRTNYLFFGTAYGIGDGNKIKGFHFLVEALKKLHQEGKLNGVELLALGEPPEKSPLDFVKTHFLGVVEDEKRLIRILNASNVAIVPSIMENLSNMIVESLACGVPIVAFRVGGIPEIVNHLEYGYLATPYDTNDLARGLEWVLNHQAPDNLARNARKIVMDRFAQKEVVTAYLKLCRKLLGTPRE